MVGQPLITILGAGKVGMATAVMLMMRGYDDLLLIARTPGKPQGEALDLAHAAAELGVDIRISGGNSYEDMRGSDIVLVTAGIGRKPGMTREQLLEANANTMADLAEKIKAYAKDAIVVITTNPVDAMTYVMYKKTGFPRERVIGFSGILDSARMAYYISQKLGVSFKSVNAIVLGMHGQKMFPVPRLSSVGGVPLEHLMSKEEIEEVVSETVNAGAKITELRGYSSNYGPAAGLVLTVEAIKRDSKRIYPYSLYLQGEYGYNDVVAEVPAVIGKSGIERIIELPLTEDEKKKFDEAVQAVKKLVETLPPQLRE
uniref:Malate dehydrogenase n=1 Tax=Aeropyrum pernix TaxID=56636 RepID=Q18MT7_AERPX|nr:malate dehydrogenase [Aeropyrum pernix]